MQVIARAGLTEGAAKQGVGYQQRSNVAYFSDEAECLHARQAQARYSHLLELVEGWDGHDGRIVSQNTFLFGIQLLRQAAVDDSVAVHPQIVPLSYGGIQIEWHSEKADLEIEIERPYRFHVYFYDAIEKRSEEFSGSNDFAPIEDLIGRL